MDAESIIESFLASRPKEERERLRPLVEKMVPGMLEPSEKAREALARYHESVARDFGIA